LALVIPWDKDFNLQQQLSSGLGCDISLILPLPELEFNQYLLDKYDIQI